MNALLAPSHAISNVNTAPAARSNVTAFDIDPTSAPVLIARTAVDFAHCMRDLVDVHDPQTKLIRVVLDNLSTHTAGALYETFPAPEAHRVLQRLEFHYTPKHASWLNMVEIEIGVLRAQCLNRRIDARESLVAEVQAWRQQRNASGARIKWMFTTHGARAKLARVYPKIANES